MKRLTEKTAAISKLVVDSEGFKGRIYHARWPHNIYVRNVRNGKDLRIYCQDPECNHYDPLWVVEETL